MAVIFLKGRSVVSRIGAWLFKHRSYTGVPLFVAMACVFWNQYEHDSVTWSLGSVLLMSGLVARFWAVRHIGRSARTRSEKARQLVTAGPYALMRNPLYFGNMLIGLGACVLSRLLWMIPIFLVLFGLQYAFIIEWEQGLLREKFGRAYEDYAGRVPAFFPQLRNLKSALVTPAIGVREALFREKDTLIGAAVMVVVFGAKEVLDHMLFYSGR